MSSSVDKTIEVDTTLNYVLKIRVYGYRSDASVSHSYLVDDLPTGTSGPIGELNINIWKMTLKQLRPIIQYNKSDHMDRRSLIFQEILFIMNRLPNHFNKPTEDWNKYCFGFINKKTDELLLIDSKDEDKPIGNLINTVEFFDMDLGIVPLSQIPPPPSVS